MAARAEAAWPRLVRNWEHIITFLSPELRAALIREDESGSTSERRAAARALTGALLSRSVTDEYRMKGVEKVKYLSADEGGVDGSDSTVRASLASLMAFLNNQGVDFDFGFLLQEKSALLGKDQPLDEAGSNGKIL